MQAIKCEMCGSSDLIKQDGVFVCQHCGCKYSLEEAKKLLVYGTVKIDSTENIEKYITLAEKAYDTHDGDKVLYYSEKILEIDPSEPRGWILKMKSTRNRASLEHMYLDEMIQSGENAIENSKSDHDRVFNEVYHYITNTLCLYLDFVISLLSRTQELESAQYYASWDSIVNSDRPFIELASNTVTNLQNVFLNTPTEYMFRNTDALKCLEYFNGKIVDFWKALRDRMAIYSMADVLSKDALDSNLSVLNSYADRVRAELDSYIAQRTREHWASHPDDYSRLEGEIEEAQKELNHMQESRDHISEDTRYKDIQNSIAEQKGKLKKTSILKTKERKAIKETIEKLLEEQNTIVKNLDARIEHLKVQMDQLVEKIKNPMMI